MANYKYNPHRHIKIWLSNNPKVFINLENQIRLISMREKNPDDLIHLIYDSTLLTSEAQEELHQYCNEHRITPIDAHQFAHQLDSDNEQRLFEFYQDEITHLDEGGNLAVGSDILRWLSPVYRLGTYTDFDVPVDTTGLPPFVEVQSPLLLNIGSLKMGKKEFILANNDYVAVVDEHGAQERIKKIQKGIISKLSQYDNDFIEKTVAQFKDNFLNRYMIKLMKNRSETLYISKSKEIKANHLLPSRQIRNEIRRIMSDQMAFLSFSKIAAENTEQTIGRLRKMVHQQLNLIKKIFFRKEYAELKQVITLNDSHFLDYLMKKELNLYIKSIIICTTGPIEIANALFDGYVMESQELAKKVKPLSFNYYQLQKSFQSQNSIPLHESPIGMIKFLGVSEGEVNDSSWLESGRLLQQMRIEQLQKQKDALKLNVPVALTDLKTKMEAHKNRLSKKLSTHQRIAQKDFLEKILTCFAPETFDVEQFKTILQHAPVRREQANKLFSNQTQKLVQHLEKISHNAVIFGLTQNRRIKWRDTPYS